MRSTTVKAFGCVVVLISLTLAFSCGGGGATVDTAGTGQSLKVVFLQGYREKFAPEISGTLYEISNDKYSAGIQQDGRYIYFSEDPTNPKNPNSVYAELRDGSSKNLVTSSKLFIPREKLADGSFRVVNEGRFIELKSISPGKDYELTVKLGYAEPLVNDEYGEGGFAPQEVLTEHIFASGIMTGIEVSSKGIFQNEEQIDTNGVISISIEDNLFPKDGRYSVKGYLNFRSNFLIEEEKPLDGDMPSITSMYMLGLGTESDQVFVNTRRTAILAADYSYSFFAPNLPGDKSYVIQAESDEPDKFLLRGVVWSDEASMGKPLLFDMETSYAEIMGRVEYALLIGVPNEVLIFQNMDIERFRKSYNTAAAIYRHLEDRVEKRELSVDDFIFLQIKYKIAELLINAEKNEIASLDKYMLYVLTPFNLNQSVFDHFFYPTDEETRAVTVTGNQGEEIIFTGKVVGTDGVQGETAKWDSVLSLYSAELSVPYAPDNLLLGIPVNYIIKEYLIKHFVSE